jgi:hypothetical protein
VTRGPRFDNAGTRAVQIGGTTGTQFFRPALPDTNACEARDITVEGNTITGSEAAVAFAGADGGVVRYNTIYQPDKWVVRIVQESRGEPFVPCRNGAFHHNLIVFRAAGFQTAVNIGSQTQPETFKFANNFWYCSDAPARSAPQLPSPEADGITGQDPQLLDPAHGDLRPDPAGPAAKYGAEALPAETR